MNTQQDHGDAADLAPDVECLVERDLRALIAVRPSDKRGPKSMPDAAAARVANWMHQTSRLQLHGRKDCGGDFGAEDVAQECLLHLWEKGMPTFNSSRSAKAFLRGMLRNRIATRAGKHARRRTGQMGDIDPADHRAIPVEQAISSERPTAVLQSVA